jgi:HAD superfamily hydrolase (TIGR01484 family)
MQSNIKLIAADIDGTILTGTENKLSERVRQSIINAMPETEVALITGRSFAEVEPILAQLNHPQIWLGLGGGTEVRNPQGEIVSEVQIERGTLGALQRHLGGNQHVNLLGRSGWTTADRIDVESHVRAAVIANLPFEEAVSLQIECSEIYPELFVSVGTDIEFPERFVVFLQPRIATKGEALKIIQDNLGISEQETAAIGDMTLDVPMFERAYYSVAMGNAPEEVRLRARIIVESVERDGAAELFEMAAVGDARLASSVDGEVQN